MLHENLGFVGNIWVRQNTMELVGDTNGGHAHQHDHVTLLVRGSVDVKVGEYPSKTFTAPTFIVIRKGLKHTFTALQDDTIYYCVFALRDIDGDPTEIIQEQHTPFSLATNEPDIFEQFIEWRNRQQDQQIIETTNNPESEQL